MEKLSSKIIVPTRSANALDGVHKHNHRAVKHPFNHAVRNETHRYIRYSDGSEELYDLRKDPNEWSNLASDESLTSLKAELANFIPDLNAEPAMSGLGKRKKANKKAR